MLKKLLILFIVINLLVSCSSNKKESSNVGDPFLPDDRYESWLTYTYQDIKIYYPEGHPLENKLNEMVKIYRSIREQSCRFFRIDIPQDTLRIFFYTGFGQGTEMTGKEYPFGTTSAVHFWIPSYYGPPLIQYLLPKWQVQEPKYKFLKHGLIAMLDFSGHNWHFVTEKSIETGKFIPLEKLAYDTTVNSNTERDQSAEASSFIDFIVYNYGFDMFEQLYLTDKPFDQAISEIYGLPVDSIQTLWLQMAEKMAIIDSTKTNDTINK